MSRRGPGAGAQAHSREPISRAGPTPSYTLLTLFHKARSLSAWFLIDTIGDTGAARPRARVVIVPGFDPVSPVSPGRVSRVVAVLAISSYTPLNFLGKFKVRVRRRCAPLMHARPMEPRSPSLLLYAHDRACRTVPTIQSIRHSHSQPPSKFFTKLAPAEKTLEAPAPSQHLSKLVS